MTEEGIHEGGNRDAQRGSQSAVGLPVSTAWKYRNVWAQSFALGLAVLVGIDLQRHGQPGMTEDELSVTGRNLQVLE
jgi:hypothetical protein